jgi:probable HAF family extracellular repeat protein
VGAYTDVSNARPITPLRGFLLEDGVFTRIDVPGATETLPQGINDRGQIVGAYADAEGTIHGFLLDKGVLTTIDVPGALNTGANDINERGQIVGFFLDDAGEGQ